MSVSLLEQSEIDIESILSIGILQSSKKSLDENFEKKAASTILLMQVNIFI